MKTAKKELVACGISLSIILLYLSPLLFYGQNSYVLIHDNLDSALPLMKILAESGQVFGSFDSTIPNIMNGLPRNVFGSEFNVILSLFYFFEPFTAYVINQFLSRLIAFFGMYLLLRKHFLKEGDQLLTVTGVALAFSLLPFWPMGGISVAGQPLVFYAFLNIRSSFAKPTDWVIITAVPLYSSLVLSYLFFILALLGLWLYDTVILKQPNIKLVIAITFMLLIFLIVEYRLIYMFLFDPLVSHRIEFRHESISLNKAIKNSLQNFFYGHYHAASLHTYFINATIILAGIITVLKKTRERLLLCLLGASALISAGYGFWNWNGLDAIKNQVTLLGIYQFDRFYFLHPLIWYIIFALALVAILRHFKLVGRVITFSLILFQILFLFYNSNFMTEKRQGNPTFAQFYAECLFKDIENYIGLNKENYRIVSIGLHPGVAQFNGFYTLDGYVSNYPLNYKYEFRQIIEKELAKNDHLKDYYDNWGSRCYIFVDELFNNLMITKHEDISIEMLELNTKALKEMGGKFIFSTVEIINYRDSEIIYCNTFENDKTHWKIYLYEVKG